ncbi:MAG: S8 family serine peptidase [Bacteroidia bacterium]|nr:S8 family serine peptidase [Bacteroidia bacterium]
MKKTGMVIVMLLLAFQARPQTAPGKYWVQFTDKANTPYSISQPKDFLSDRAIERRARYKVSIHEQDLPIDPAYPDSLRKLGVTVLNRSKWFNAVTIYTTDTTVLSRIRQLSFVRQLKCVRTTKSSRSVNDKFSSEFLSASNIIGQTDTTILQYGQATRQVGMLNGHILHNQGFQGQGMVIAVLDAGFSNVNSNHAFDTLWMRNQVLGNWDFVNNRPVAFDGHPHGAQVLSIMGGNLPAQLVGSAPKASYYLLITEDAAREYLVEEDNWVSGAEFADSVGADLINSSLGYSIFDDPSMNHTYADMNGKTARITIAADIACTKGILVVSSAANEGAKAWHYITAPADADSILTVGAVDSLGKYAYFSSTGPTFDGRVKPNIAGQGLYTALVNTDGNVIRGSGTSFSSPLICGLTACLWQANRSRSPMEIIKAIQESASQANSPDSLLGFGIPDYGKALFLIQGMDPIHLDKESLFRVYPNPFTANLTVDFYSHDRQEIIIELVSATGELMYKRIAEVGYTSINRLDIYEFQHIAPGIYFLRIITKTAQHQHQVVKVRE